MLIESLDDGGEAHSAPPHQELDDGDDAYSAPPNPPPQELDVAVKALVGVGARLLFYPTLFCNLVRNKLEADFRWWDEIEQLLLLGAVPFPKDVVRLKSLGVEAVITLNESYETLVSSSLYESYMIKHLVIPTRDYLFAPSFNNIERAVDFIHENIKQKKAVYVHCKAGRARSTTIVLCYLVKYRGMSPADALNHVRSRRPRVSLAPAQWKAVLRYSRYQHPKSKVDASALPLMGQQWPLYKSLAIFKDAEAEVLSQHNTSYCGEVPVMITLSDLEGYQEMRDADLMGSSFQGNLVYKVGVVTSSVVGLAKASVTLTRLSYIWLGYQQAQNRGFNMTLTCSALADVNKQSVGVVSLSVCPPPQGCAVNC